MLPWSVGRRFVIQTRSAAEVLLLGCRKSLQIWSRVRSWSNDLDLLALFAWNVGDRRRTPSDTAALVGSGFGWRFVFGLVTAMENTVNSR